MSFQKGGNEITKIKHCAKLRWQEMTEMTVLLKYDIMEFDVVKAKDKNLLGKKLLSFHFGFVFVL